MQVAQSVRNQRGGEKEKERSGKSIHQETDVNQRDQSTFEYYITEKIDEKKVTWEKPCAK